jgi:biotin carboxyl carrier protein
MRATVTAMTVTQGDAVSAGQILGSVEAMKMEHPLTSPTSGRVLAVRASVGQLVSTGEVLLDVAPPGRAAATTEPEGATDAAP